MTLAALSAAAFALVVWAAPWAAVATLALNALAAAIAQALPLLAMAQPDPLRATPSPPASFGGDPFVSVHALLDTAPPGAARRMIGACAALTYPAYEVISVRRGPPSALEGSAAHVRAAAGASEPEAFNAALEVMDWRAAYVAPLDARFAPAPHFLRLAVDHLARVGVSFVQFRAEPEADHRLGQAIALEQESLAPGLARATRAMLLSGAPAVIAISALRQVGAWRGAALAPEADLGARLLRAGLRGLYVDAPAGWTLATPDLDQLIEQRARWVRGAAQTLRRDFRAFLAAGGIAPLATLAAGHSFWLAPITALAAVGAVRALEPERLGPALLAVDALAAATILATAILGALRLGFRGLARRRPLIVIAKALLVRLALAWTGSTAWLDDRPPRTGARVRSEAALATIAGGAAALLALVQDRMGAVLAALVVLASAASLSWLRRALAREAAKA